MSILISCGAIVLLLVVTMIYIRAMMLIVLKQNISSFKFVTICILLSSLYMVAIIGIISI